MAGLGMGMWPQPSESQWRKAVWWVWGKCLLVPNGSTGRDSPFFVPWALSQRAANTERKAEPRDAHRLDSSLSSSLDPALSLSFRLQRIRSFLIGKPVWVPLLTLNVSLLTYIRPTTWGYDQVIVHSNPWKTNPFDAPLHVFNAEHTFFFFFEKHVYSIKSL